MKKTAGLFLSFLSGLALSGLGLAADFEASKNAPLQNIFPNSYGNLVLKHILNKSGESTKPEVQARYILGSTFFDGKLDSWVTLGAIRQAGTPVVSQRPVQVESYYTLYKNDYVTVSPFLDAFLPSGEKGTRGEMGMYVPVSYEQSLSAGKVKLLSEMVFAGSFGTRKEDFKTEVTRAGKPLTDDDVKRSSLSLTKDNDSNSYMESSQASNLRGTVTFGAGFEPKLVSGLSMALISSHTQQYVPVMELNTKTNTVGLKKAGFMNQPEYKNTYSSEQQLSVGYKLRDGLSVANDFIVKSIKDGKMDYANAISLSASLF